MSVISAYIVPHPPIILPAVGRGEEKKIQKTADSFRMVSRKISEVKPETVVVISPHSVMYRDYIHISPGPSASGDFGQFGAPQVSVKKDYDMEFVSALVREAESAGISAGTEGERDRSLDHGVLVPLCFLEQQYRSYRIVRVSLSGLPLSDHYVFGTCITKAAERLGRKTVILASGDLSHRLKEDGPYGLSPEGPVFDAEVTAAMKTADFSRFLRFNAAFCESAAECGLRSFVEMAGALDGKAVESEFLSYEGPFGVGYALCCYTVTGDAEDRRFLQLRSEEREERPPEKKAGGDPYVNLARESLETRVRTGKSLPRPASLPEQMLKNRAGVFVSLKKEGRLRGCIGTISPAAPCVADEIIRNAVSAGLEDPRFDPVRAEELPQLTYSVDVLEAPEPISSPDELDVKRYGVIVSHGWRRGLLLPNLEGVDTPGEQISIALQKAGISPRESFSMERFEVVRHK